MELRMGKKLPKTRELLELNKQSAWPMIGGVAGGLISLGFSTVFHSVVFSILNTIIIGIAFGSLYFRILMKDRKRATIVGGLVGGLCGLHLVSLWAFVFGTAALCFLLTMPAINQRLRWSPVIPHILLAVYVFFTMVLAGTVANLPSDSGRSEGIILFVIIFIAIPVLNIPTAYFAGGLTGWGLVHNAPIMHWFSKPLFSIPLLSFAGYFVGCKITEGKKPKEYIREIPEGGLLMSEDQNFPKEVSEDISPVAFSEKAMIQDLLGALNNKSLLLTKLESWKARAKGQDQLRAFEMIREMLEKETDIIRAYIDNQQARLDFKNLREFNQHIQKEKLKAQLAEEQYKQAELEEKLKRMKLEEEYKRLELQRKIKELKKTQKVTESKIERIKKEQLEKIDFQEEIRKVKTMRLADRVEYLHNWKKEIREKYPPKEAEDIINELERMLVEEGLKED